MPRKPAPEPHPFYRPTVEVGWDKGERRDVKPHDEKLCERCQEIYSAYDSHGIEDCLVALAERSSSFHVRLIKLERK